MTPRTVEEFAVRLAASGIAAGAIAAATSPRCAASRTRSASTWAARATDISLVYEGEPRVTKEWSVEYGYPIRFPSIEVLTIGAGGGSLAWIDEAGSLRNGPQSAGADPGPACYGSGGEEPTNTDANLRARPARRRAGRRRWGSTATPPRRAIRDQVAEPLGLELDEAATR